MHSFFIILFQNIITKVSQSSGSLLRTAIYTMGHFIIAATCVWYLTGADFFEAITNAIVEPLINSLWYYLLDKYWATKFKASKAQTA
ncbi:MAG: hypothetical protein CMM25_02260 [Rhodospirillaceae bacterium]|nr:hypothetical protein [Rhodospirillaceae bacterium]